MIVIESVLRNMLLHVIWFSVDEYMDSILYMKNVWLLQDFRTVKYTFCVSADVPKMLNNISVGYSFSLFYFFLMCWKIVKWLIKFFLTSNQYKKEDVVWLPMRQLSTRNQNDTDINNCRWPYGTVFNNDWAKPIPHSQLQKAPIRQCKTIQTRKLSALFM